MLTDGKNRIVLKYNFNWNFNSVTLGNNASYKTEEDIGSHDKLVKRKITPYSVQ